MSRTLGKQQYLVDSFEPRAVLLDLNMPDMNGFEVAHRMRELHCGQGIKLVAVTGWGREKEKERTALSGFDDHFVKPVSISLLQTLLAP